MRLTHFLAAVAVGAGMLVASPVPAPALAEPVEINVCGGKPEDYVNGVLNRKYEGPLYSIGPVKSVTVEFGPIGLPDPVGLNARVRIYFDDGSFDLTSYGPAYLSSDTHGQGSIDFDFPGITTTSIEVHCISGTSTVDLIEGKGYVNENWAPIEFKAYGDIAAPFAKAGNGKGKDKK